MFFLTILGNNQGPVNKLCLLTNFLMMGELIEYGRTDKIFTNPANKLTEDYITGRFG